MSQVERPLSPHIQIYKPQITSTMSILHRITGVSLGAGCLLLSWWIVATAIGPDAYATVAGFLGSAIGKLILLAFTFALYYHLCNGLRHLRWDMGRGFDLPSVTRSGWTAVICAAVMTVVTWAIAIGALARG